MATHTKRAPEKETTTTTTKVINTTHYTHRFENNERLGMSSIDDLGPRGSKGKLFKLKRN